MRIAMVDDRQEDSCLVSSLVEEWAGEREIGL